MTPGTQLGPYEILSPIGAGGMGEVYKARDSRLGRDVAIKVLPAEVARDPERLARFEREARVLASLNHTNIAQIYSVEESADGRALAMELVDGQTLPSPLPLRDALPIAMQIADALDAAHEKGIVHRDLKPANIMVTPDGVVKVLDFGLAAVANASPGNANDPANSPTMTMAATQAGVIMGTAAYMAPEQAAGKPVDRRADIWAFGVVFAEMLTGRQLFRGENVAEIIAAVVLNQPDLSDVPADVRPVIERCLRKDPRKRWQSMGDVRIALEDGLAPAAAVSGPGQARPWPWIAATAVATLLLLLLVFDRIRPAEPVRQPSYRLSLLPPGGDARFTWQNNEGGLALSPDGKTLAFVADSDGTSRLYVRALDTEGARMLPGTEGAGRPFWSPDGRSLAFVAGNKLKRIEVAGGDPVVLSSGTPRGGSWNADGTILFTKPGGIFRIPASGGEPRPVTQWSEPDREDAHYWPQFLPDGKHFLYFARSVDRPQSAIYAGSLEDAPAQKSRVRVTGSQYQAWYAPSTGNGSGFLLTTKGNSIVAQPFDPSLRRLYGDAVPVAAGVGAWESNGYSDFAVSAAGNLVFGTARIPLSTFVWRDRRGNLIERIGQPGQIGRFDLSPDGRLVAFERHASGEETSIWVLDTIRGTTSLAERAFALRPKWSPDGKEIAFSRWRDGLFRMVVGRPSPPSRLTAAADVHTPLCWSSDGRYLVFLIGPAQGKDMQLLALTGDAKPTAYGVQARNARFAAISPDGRWLAYTSSESGEEQLYVTAFPRPGDKYQVSVNGGRAPGWRSDGKMLYFLDGEGGVQEVAISAKGERISAGTPQRLFAITGRFDGPNPGFAPARDGLRFLTLEQDKPEATPLTIVVNWQGALNR